ncbi:MAG: nucleotidyl transferase AbiEii/AbiGii toxin family protein [Candidatus Cryptobacteroides sp.]|jgi:hypothetical protein
MEETDFIQGLTPSSEKVFKKISSLDCLKDLHLCGGTAQSIQMGHRLSEDIDFELLNTRETAKELNFSGIITEISGIFPEYRKEILSNNHFLLFVDNNVKLSFFCPNDKVPYIGTGFRYNNIVTPSLDELFGMKLYTINVRTVFRDYYDIYTFIKSGFDLNKAMRYAGMFSGHRFHQRQMEAQLLRFQDFKPEPGFKNLMPKYDINPEEICLEIKKNITASTVVRGKKDQT